MNEEINKIIDSLEGCIGMFDYMITPIESNLLVSYIRELQQENQKYKEVIDKVILTIKGIAYGGNEDYYIEKLKDILDILKEVE